MVRNDEWKTILREQHWIDMYLPADEYGAFLVSMLQAPAAGRAVTRAGWFGRWQTATIVTASGMLIVAIAVVAVAGVRSRRQRLAALEREATLSVDLNEARALAQRSAEQASTLLKGVGDAIDRQFDAWGLTPAEKEVASLLLKGLRHKEVADIRQTSERTVRQQSLSIYRKAGVEGRTELAAYFLEDVMPPAEPAPRGGA